MSKAVTYVDGCMSNLSYGKWASLVTWVHDQIYHMSDEGMSNFSCGNSKTGLMKRVWLALENHASSDC